jgi:hypothetical protein
METLGLILMSTAVLMYGVIPLFADLNATHAANPSWPVHARFHVVTQVLTTSSIAAVALFLLWSPAFERNLAVCLAAVLSFCVLGGFFLSALIRSCYGGALSDPRGGIPSVRGIDLNALNFGAAALLLVAGRGLLLY